MYLCVLLAAAALCRSLYRLIKRPELFVWIAALASLIATAMLTLIILVVIGLP